MLIKILKLVVPSVSKITSYDAKWAVIKRLHDIDEDRIMENKIGYWIGQCLNFETLKDKFVGIHEVLAELGFERVEVKAFLIIDTLCLELSLGSMSTW